MKIFVLYCLYTTNTPSDHWHNEGHPEHKIVGYLTAQDIVTAVSVLGGKIDTGLTHNDELCYLVHELGPQHKLLLRVVPRITQEETDPLRLVKR
jgi:hypothetical protein